MNQNEKQHIVELLCTSEPENIALAEAFCDSQNFPLETILREFGYWDVGIKWGADFAIDQLRIQNKGITKMPNVLPFSLTLIECWGNSLVKLPNLPANLEWLDYSDNPIVTPPILPQKTQYLACEGALLPANLPNSIQTLICSRCGISELPAELPKSLEVLDCSKNKIIKLPKLPISLNDLDFSYNLVSELPELPFSLQILSFRNNQIAKLPNFKELCPDLRVLDYRYNLVKPTTEEIRAFKPTYCGIKFNDSRFDT